MSHNTSPLRILVSGGGTGGHIFPALSIANELRRRHPDADILFVGAQGRMEMERVPAAGYAIQGLPVAGFDRRRLWRNIPVLIKLWRSMRQARRIVRTFKPHIAIGVGGYASGPTLKAAQRAGVPTLLQEQNSYAGVTNKLLGAKAKRVCTAYDGMERFFPAASIVKTGNPVRAGIADSPLTQAQAKEQLGFDPTRPLVLVVGGSLGARTVNQAVAAALPTWSKDGVQVLWQTGKNYIDQCRPQAQPYTGVEATAFISDMATAYRAADVVVSRAGAGTISELQVVGACTVLIPSPNVAEDHQRKNARALSSVDAAVYIDDPDAVAQLQDTVTSLLANPQQCASLRTRIAAMAQPHAAADIADIVEQLIQQ